jgi:hypothetical protein
MTRNTRLRLEGFDGEKIILSIHGDSNFKGRSLVFSPNDFLEFLKFCNDRASKGDCDFLMEVNDSIIEAQQKFLR